MNFFQKIKNSIYSPQFYATVPKQSFGQPFSYLLLLILLITALQTILPAAVFLPVGARLKTYATQVPSYFPAGLQVKIKNGKVSTNVQEPYFIQLPKSQSAHDEKYDNLAVIDTKTPFSVEQFNKYRSVVWVGRDSAFVRGDRGGELRTIDLTKIDDLTLNRQMVSNIVSKASPLLVFVLPLIIVAIFIGLYIFYLFKLVYLLFLALILWLVLKLFGRQVNYGQAYKVGMYAITLGLFVEVAIGFLHMRSYPFLFTVIALGVVLVNILSVPQKVVKAKKK